MSFFFFFLRFSGGFFSLFDDGDGDALSWNVRDVTWRGGGRPVRIGS